MESVYKESEIITSSTCTKSKITNQIKQQQRIERIQREKDN